MASALNVDGGALLADLLILPAVEVELAGRVEPTVAMIAAIENDHRVAIAMSLVEQMTFSVPAALADQHHASTAAAVTDIMNQKNVFVLSVTSQISSSGSRLRHERLDFAGRLVTERTRPKKLAETAGFIRRKPFA